ncbi:MULTISPECIES: ABC transporter permease [Prochlorococcus]|uniref:ABC-type oligopeptide transport system permease n=1 Tax=Prochlorococcus marinus (strain SARG / CCMP1375 / SS120) TaxID=167539 RepID=Q7VBE2_PROMA|nr:MULTISPECIES: ABC transporter permease [Prochlorococcus]AAQ00198.1 ABC-type oligopeptide transport system permease [Prochlorococcus marinus subsp. marinus str. CCMP1375]KGG19130.1 Dipeptide transport system permease protein DppB [Prochlorococcus marinus str. SS2]KGG32435.1 Dipeptide transport system permease protein DppB [Prochlorococcus marinus str. SS51]
MNRARSLLKYSLTRLALAPVMLWLISSLVFLLLRVAPGDPVDAILGNRADYAAREAMRAKLGLDIPLINQYFKYLNGLIHGDLGQSLNNQESVRETIANTLPASIELGIIALLIASIIGLIVGFTGIAKPEGKTDLAGRLFGIGTYALPPFWAAMLIQMLFAVVLGWLPVGGRFPPSLSPPQGSGFLILDSIRKGDLDALGGAIRHLVLPASTLGILLSGIFSRSLRINLEKVLSTNYIQAASSRGIKKSQIIFSHALPNALLPVLTIAGLTISSLIGGALLIEVTFSWPGIALGLKEAISQRDYNMVQGIVVIISTIVVMVSLTIDLLIAFIDPRVKY